MWAAEHTATVTLEEGRVTYQAEMQFLGMELSPPFVGQPEVNGCVELLIRTLKEQLLWVHTLRTVEELRQALAEFREQYNQHWLAERLVTGRQTRPGSNCLPKQLLHE